jgi:hypothetical protein
MKFSNRHSLGILLALAGGLCFYQTTVAQTPFVPPFGFFGAGNTNNATPRLTITSPVASTVFYPATQAAVTVSGTCSNPGKTITITQGIQSLATASCDIGRSFSTSSVNLTSLADGDYTLVASLTNDVGNTGTASVAINKDTAGPQIAIDAVGTLTGGGSSSITFKVTEPHATNDVHAYSVEATSDASVATPTWQTLGYVTGTTGALTNQTFSYSWSSIPVWNTSNAKIRVTGTDLYGNVTSPLAVSNLFNVDSSVPSINNGTYSINASQAPASTKVRTVLVSVAGTSTYSNITHICFKSTTSGSAPTAPSASDTCWVDISQSPLSVTPATAVTISNYQLVLPSIAGTYKVYAWLKNETNHITTNTATNGFDVISIQYILPIPATLANVVGSKRDAVGSPLDATLDLTVSAGADVYIKWKATDDETLPSNSVSITYTTDEVIYTPVAGATGIANAAGSGCTVDGTTYTGCFKLAAGAPTATLFKFRVQVIDNDSNVTLITTPFLNIATAKILAGNTDAGIGGSALSAFLSYNSQGSSLYMPDPHTFVVLSNGDIYVIDYVNGLIKIDANTRTVTQIIKKNSSATITASETITASTLLKKPVTITADYSNNLYIYDTDRVRKLTYDASANSFTTIATLIGGGAVVPGSGNLADPKTLFTSAVIGDDWGGNSGTNADFAPLVRPLPNGDIWTRLETSGNASSKLYMPAARMRFRKYDHTTGALNYLYDFTGVRTGSLTGSSTLSLDMTAADTLLNVPAAATLPPAGTLKIDSEYVDYVAGLTGGSYLALAITARGGRGGSVPSAHLNGATVTYMQNTEDLFTQNATIEYDPVTSNVTAVLAGQKENGVNVTTTAAPVLAAAIANGSDATLQIINGNASVLPSSGIFKIDNELMLFTKGTVGATNTTFNITRGYANTMAAAHTSGTKTLFQFQAAAGTGNAVTPVFYFTRFDPVTGVALAAPQPVYDGNIVQYSFSYLQTGMDGKIYVINRPYGTILQYNSTTNAWAKVAGSGMRGKSACSDGQVATAATCSLDPVDVFAALDGTVYLFESGAIRFIDKSSGKLYTIAGQFTTTGDGGGPLSARFGEVTAIKSWRNGSGTDQFTVLDFSQARFREFSDTGTISTIAGNGVMKGSSFAVGPTSNATQVELPITIYGNWLTFALDATSPTSGASPLRAGTIWYSYLGAGNAIGIAYLDRVTGKWVQTIGNNQLYTYLVAADGKDGQDLKNYDATSAAWAYNPFVFDMDSSQTLVAGFQAYKTTNVTSTIKRYSMTDTHTNGTYSGPLVPDSKIDYTQSPVAGLQTEGTAVSSVGFCLAGSAVETCNIPTVENLLAVIRPIDNSLLALIYNKPSAFYWTGNATQAAASTTVVGSSGASWSATVVGKRLVYISGAGCDAGPITGFTDATHITVTNNCTVTNSSYFMLNPAYFIKSMPLTGPASGSNYMSDFAFLPADRAAFSLAYNRTAGGVETLYYCGQNTSTSVVSLYKLVLSTTPVLATSGVSVGSPAVGTESIINLGIPGAVCAARGLHFSKDRNSLIVGAKKNGLGLVIEIPNP